MRGARTGGLAVMLAVTAGSLVGCIAPASAPTETPTSADGQSSTESPRPSGSVPATPPQDAKPDNDPDAANEATTAAVLAVTAYCRPDLEKGAWIAALSPLLTDAGAVAYNTVSPATVPCTSVTGGSTVRDGDNAYVFRINVPTDAGTYEVYVTRPATTEPWRVERMAPPK
ncbi:hypothetical protein [Herbiconiux liukaitaii]|uniref:hypothetical protein n=1 Tax=Herbiconiux liukaitaii TaxID=3342799 RepID=UPI0035B8EDA0